jgi:hypothetical protein
MASPLFKTKDSFYDLKEIIQPFGFTHAISSMAANLPIRWAKLHL